MLSASLRRAGRALCLGALLSACDDISGPGDGLTVDDVAGFYRACVLSFDPEGDALPTVDIRAAAFELSRPEDVPRLALDVSPMTMELRYTPKGQFTDRELRGSYQIRRESVVLRFDRTGADPITLLLPENRALEFEFQASPRTLTLAASEVYSVAKSDYQRLAGISEPNLADRVNGRLSARFGSPCT